ncbi:hypothetical protein ACO0LC_18670 [Undibacterium sp. JH2W]
MNVRPAPFFPTFTITALSDTGDGTFISGNSIISKSPKLFSLVGGASNLLVEFCNFNISTLSMSADFE